MMKKNLYLFVLMTAFTMLSVNIKAGNTIYVPHNYQDIQTAVNAASPGDEIHVTAGTYQESLYIDKNISLYGIDNPVLLGEPGNLTKPSSNSNTGIIIAADNVIIDGFTIRNYDLGIEVSGNNNILTYNNITGMLNETGIAIIGSGNEVLYNRVTGLQEGIVIYNAVGNLISWNWVYQNNTGLINLDEITSVDAVRNWWGDETGPGGIGEGQGDLLYGNVIYSPWYFEEEMINLSQYSITIPAVIPTFNALTSDGKYVQLLWIAETETSMLGYNIYRSQVDEVSKAEKINNQLIGAYNSSSATDYSYLDVDVKTGETYFYWLELKDIDLTDQFFGPVSVLVNENGDADLPELPLETRLIGSYPNPFNPGTHIAFSLDEPARVTISIYNNRGQFIKTLASNKNFKAGRQHSVYFDGKNHQGNEITSGIYFYIMKTDNDYREARKMLLLK
jgi:hypothetical protein